MSRSVGARCRACDAAAMDATAEVPAELGALAARSLAAGDALDALKVVGPFGGPHALALRGIALAQMGAYPEAKAALGRAARAFAAAGAERARARASAALAEIALAQRDIGEAWQGLVEAGDALERAGDLTNAAWARLGAARAALLEGRVAEAERALAAAEATVTSDAPVFTRAALALVRAEVHARLVRASSARRAAEQAAAWARASGHPLLSAEAERFLRAHDEPVARLVQGGRDEPARLADVEALVAAPAGRVVVDALRRRVLDGGEVRADLARRPVLFALLEALARAHPAAIASDDLARAAFGVRAVNESHRRRLRVEVGRLRAELGGVGVVRALGNAYRWELGAGAEVVVLAPLEPGDAGAIRALLSDGAAWSASAIGAALGKSARTVQRALAELSLARAVEVTGSGPSRRYARPRAALSIASQMLLLGLALPG
ncbi:helix-turn-helix domain-containing protein [Sorangium sp. KYC3313]|uniref:helix-turn-helix domain-containing protein n=1 Tax=Sorangium sp. KYC3313 TaxID=3449740 RepID=UPI003F88B769